MAAPTAIPHPENSTHHAAPPRSNSPPLVSPVYSRTAFSLPGAPTSGHQSSFRNTANGGWAPAGVGAMSGSPTKTSSGGIKGHTIPQRDTFPERRGSIAEAARHSRAFSGSSSSGASLSSSVSSVDSFGGPPTPRTSTHDSNASGAATSGAPLGRVHSIPLATSPYEAIKGRRESWSYAGPPSSPPGTGGWPGFGLLRGNRSPPAFNKEANDMVSVNNDSSATTGSGGMSGLFRKLSVGGQTTNAGYTAHRPHHHHHHHSHHHGHRSASVSAVEAPTTPTPKPAPQGRGRQASVGSGTAPKRKPSPHGERLLMGWTHAH